MKQIIAVVALLSSLPLSAADITVAPLPPAPPWGGETRKLMVAATDPWITPSEKSNLTATPDYDETVAWLRKLVAAAPQLRMVSLGKSGEGRDLWMVVASKEKAATPEALRANGKPTVFVQAGIHSGEIDGKDAGLMLLRDMTVRGTKRDLLDRANLLFVPIFNVDGHERTSRFSRINQRGPEVQGWRTNARNFNLNRDYVKADTEEMRAMLRALVAWNPDLYVDVHVTDGADYQYDITFGWNNVANWSPSISTWLNTTFRPAMNSGLKAAGHIPGPLVFGVAGDDLSKGIFDWTSDPRFSNGYGDARHMAAILVENHSLKPYDQRVLGTYVFLEQALRTLGAQGSDLRTATAKAAASREPTIPVVRAVSSTPDMIEFLGIESRRTLSAVSGQIRTEWLGRPVTMRIPYVHTSEVTRSVTRPAAYWVPAAWAEVITRLDLHGIRYERIKSAQEIEVEMLRLTDVKYEDAAVEGHVRVSATTTPEKRRERFPAGSVRVSTDQPRGTLAVLMFEPSSPDSLFQWGFFHSILLPSEYAESYMLEPLAELMLQDPAVRREFEAKVDSDAAFRNDPAKRLDWFYRRSPWYEERSLLYPVGREVN